MLIENRQTIDEAFAAAELPQPLEWAEDVTAGRWVIRYRVDINYKDEPDKTKMLELNHASAQMKRVFDPHLKELDPELENDFLEPFSEDVGDQPTA